MIQPVARIQPLTKIDKVHRDKHKISVLPPELTLNKPKNKTWTELLSPWLIVGGFLLVYGLLNGWIGD